MTSRCALIATLALALVVAPLAGQSWKGPAALRLEVSAYRGGPVAGAQVVVRTARQGSSGGPPPSYTDARGEVEIGGLVAGDWRVEVVHPDHMTFVATVRISPADKPVALSTAHQAGEGSGGPLKVRLQKPRGRDVGSSEAPTWAQGRAAAVAPPSAPPAPTPPVVPTAPVPAPAPSEPEAAAPTPAAPESVALEPTTPEPVAPEPVAPQPVVPEPAAPEPAAPEPAAPEPAAPEPTAPEPATPEPPAPDTQSPMQSQSPVPPAEPPTAEPTPPAVEPTSPVAVSQPIERSPSPVLPVYDPSRYVRAAGPGGCLDCKPGEWSVAVEVRAGAKDSTGCAGALARGGTLAAAAEGWDLSAYAGPAVAPDAPWPSVEAGTGSCVLVAVAIPAGARFLGYGFGARDASGSGGCLPRQECGIGQARWDGDPRTTTVGGAKVFWAVFENMAADERFAELKIWFAPPTKEWRPSAPTR